VDRRLHRHGGRVRRCFRRHGRDVMRILYRCDCMAAEAGVEFRDRQDCEDVTAWAQDAKRALAEDHAKRSPRCVRASVNLIGNSQIRKER